MNPLLLPPRLALRALDDLHTIALAARDLNGRLEGLEQRADRIEAQLETAIEAALGIERRAAALLEVFERVETHADAAMAQAQLVTERAALVAESGAQVAAALPLLQRAIELSEPLEGAVERLGRIVDRLPGGRRAPAARG